MEFPSKSRFTLLTRGSFSADPLVIAFEFAPPGPASETTMVAPLRGYLEASSTTTPLNNAEVEVLSSLGVSQNLRSLRSPFTFAFDKVSDLYPLLLTTRVTFTPDEVSCKSATNEKTPLVSVRVESFVLPTLYTTTTPYRGLPVVQSRTAPEMLAVAWLLSTPVMLFLQLKSEIAEIMATNTSVPNRTFILAS
jgi:hypothetical protein